MILYHGSNVPVERPRIIENNRSLDYGKAFYVTSDYDQAARWATLTTKRRREGRAVVTLYHVDMVELQNLSVMQFEKADAEWLRFISRNRKGEEIGAGYDLIIGPVANDNTMPVINLYLKGAYNEEEAVKRLLPQKLKNQYAFKTGKSIECLDFQEVVYVG